MQIFVFSYNRGPFLENCIRSIEACAPQCKLTIIDDGSDDPNTRQVLASIRERHQVVENTADSGHKLGGLYANMQAAYEMATGDELICFLQDDTQMVRPLTDTDLIDLRNSFDQQPDLGFISPAFVRGISIKKPANRDFRFDLERNFWFWYPRKRSTGTWFSALLIADPARLRKVDWHFEVGESVNNHKAAKIFCRMARMRAPFSMWLPNGRAYRGKQKSLALRFGEWSRRCGLYPLEVMSDKEVQTLKTAEPARLPVAEDFLKTTHGRIKLPWAYDPMQGAGWLKSLDRLERKLRGLFK
ncbi:glycosyltransferase family 2 protein [Gilvimarinus agarilyticus]|uniref:glycosyltransferase family 2 protein n=1 Tax=unclassified Gilvimarinus TaxID=2642066 RepID=UPI001C0982B2|nr:MULTISPECIES: glycosyltransferase family A protein [unclassified Gilvimarinus]MBU2884145.1 glycosyltransferase family 2 protein [Gilvimarinus agarilyticus]MDO6569317.1 glycosyltransferase family A protein [Gilvimarinus sp. 2_MG-2023]MDO6747064.1 glycosyltransferase family A protein [Gilvimarinus sp. 1_MG-2023]